MKRGKIMLSLAYMAGCLMAAVLLPFYVVCGEQKAAYTDILFSAVRSADVHEILSEYADTCKFVNVRELFENDTMDETYYCARAVHSGSYSDEDLVEMLRGDGAFGVVEIDCEFQADVIPDGSRDTYMQDQWYLERTGAKRAWSMLVNEPGEGAVVAVIDTGVDYSHPDIKKNMWVNIKEYYGIPGYDDDGNGIADDIYGADIVNMAGNPSDDDKDGHGTHVAGIIAMTAGNGGGCGIAYGARIMAIKAGGSDGLFKMSNVVDAVNYAIDMGADVINMSFGTYSESEVIRAALEKASQKCILVAAAGNESLPNTESGAEDSNDAYPAAYPFVIGVMAEDRDGNLMGWSNYDAEPHSMIEYEMSAPGVDILSVAVGRKYAYMNGTSMAAPMVSAAAAILYAAIDKESVEDPVHYVAGQLTRAGMQYSEKSFSDGNTIRYKSLNIAEALENKPGVDIEVGNIHFKDAAEGAIFRDEYTFDSEGRKEVYCGFVVDNAWSGAKDVSVKVSSSDSRVQIGRDTVNIGEMDAYRKLDFGFGDGSGKGVDSGNREGNANRDKYGTVSFVLDAKADSTYTFTLTFEVTGRMASKDDAVCTRKTEKVITINVKHMTPEESGDNNREAGAETLAAPSKPYVRPNGTYIAVSWDSLPNAEGYYVYRSNKQEKGYKLIASVKASDGLSYKDKEVKAGKKYYYKIKAYSTGGSESPYSGIAFGIGIGRVSGLDCERNMRGTKYENHISWKKLNGVEKYVIYYSERKSGGFKKIAATSKSSYNHRFLRKKTYYYKVRAYARGSSGKSYGKYSKVIKVKR